MSQRIPPTGNGRAGGGRFAVGNPGGPGRPPNEKALTLRRVFLDEISEEDMREIVGELKRQAKAGDLSAIRDILDRICGRPMPADVQVEIDELAAQVAALEKTQ